MAADAENWVVISALTVGGIYAYRRVTETAATSTTLKGIAGQGAPVPLGAFVTAWGCVFFVISIMAAANPDLGRAMALLVATADLITNGQQIANDITKKVTGSSTASSGTSSSSSSSSSSTVGAPGTGAQAPPFSPIATVTSPFSGTMTVTTGS